MALLLVDIQLLTLEDIEQTELKLNDKIEVNEVFQLEIPKFNTIDFSHIFSPILIFREQVMRRRSQF